MYVCMGRASDITGPTVKVRVRVAVMMDLVLQMDMTEILSWQDDFKRGTPPCIIIAAYKGLGFRV